MSSPQPRPERYAKRVWAARTVPALAGAMLFQVCAPTVALALTTGPAQPEFASFEPAGTTQMVDLFSGDFTYNIPLFELPGPDGGYPFNLAYQSGVTMDQEASWVGLGWTLNPGAISRTMQGIPDDFDGQEVEVLDYMDEERSTTYGFGLKGEVFGVKSEPKLKDRELNKEPSLNLSYGLSYTFSNYTGVSVNRSFGIGLGLPAGDNGLKIRPGLSFNANSLSGASVGANVGVGFPIGSSFRGNLGVGATMASRTGLESTHLSAGVSQQRGSTEKGAKNRALNMISAGASSGIQLAPTLVSYTPTSGRQFEGSSFSGSLAVGGAITPVYFGGDVNYTVTKRTLVGNGRWVGAPAYGTLNSKSRFDIEPNAVLDFNRAGEAAISANATNLAAPQLTPDAFTVTGQGIGGLFVAERRDVGIYTDPNSRSSTAGLNVGVEVGIPLEFGATAGGNSSRSSTNHWAKVSGVNDATSGFRIDANSLSGREPVYFRNGAEITAEATAGTSRFVQLGGDAPLSFQSLRKRDVDGKPYPTISSGAALLSEGYENERVAGKVRSDTVRTVTHQTAAAVTSSRAIRGNVILPVTSRDLAAATNPTLGALFSPTIYDVVGERTLLPGEEADRTSVARTTRDSRVAGFLTTNTSGMRYNYTLPVLNTKHYQASFSVKPPDADEVWGNAGNQSVQIPRDVVGDLYPCPAGDPDCQVAITQYRADRDKLTPHQRIVFTPEYAHSYLLTNVLGTDYIDVNQNGPDPEDEGYWVKFDYAQTASKENPYRWKAPYEGAAYNPGIEGYDRDHSANFVAGERESYYLYEASTRTHVARFFSSRRRDAIGAPSMMHNRGASVSMDLDGGLYSYKLDSIQLVTRNELERASRADESPVPIQTTVLEYSGYDGGDVREKSIMSLTLPNAVSAGKLTLKRVYTVYKDNQRGKLTPYQFEYNEGDYSKYANDLYHRWGGVKPTAFSGRSSDDPNLTSVPGDSYVPQTASQLPEALRRDGKSLREHVDEACAAWNLSRVTLPSGATIDVKYESDDYGFVQDRLALQMVPLAGVTNSGGATVPTQALDGDDEDLLKVYFDYEDDGDRYGHADDPRPWERYAEGLHGAVFDRSAGGTGARRTELLDGAQLLFKIRVSQRPGGGDRTGNDLVVTGYAEVQAFGDDGTATAPRPYALLKPVKLGRKRGDADKLDGYHPFAAATWMYLRDASPHLLSTSGSALDNANNPAESPREANAQLRKASEDFKEIFKDYYKYCSGKGFGSDLRLEGSYLRLATPDRSKLGGGSRVRAVVLSDNWAIDRDDRQRASGDRVVSYGQVYDYDHVERDDAGEVTRRYSSGVAVNEPAVGYEECALRYVRQFRQETVWRDANLGQATFPMQETLLPGASVGYAEVRVRSLAAHRLLGEDTALLDFVEEANAGTDVPLEDYDYEASGETAHLFYTAREFPVILQETQLRSALPAIRQVPLLFFNKRNDSYVGTQGYSITTNDMHGKQRQVSHYSLSSAGLPGLLVNQTSYTYHDAPYVRLEGENPIVSRQLTNEVPVLVGDGVGQQKTEVRQLGLSTQVMLDMRETFAEQTSDQVDINAFSFPPLLPPIPIPVPTFRESVAKIRTAVTGKVVRRQGILKAVEVFDGQSRQRTENLAFDPYTGQALETSVTNSFDAPVYHYAMPAYAAYDGMGPAYLNAGARFTVPRSALTVDESCKQIEVNSSALARALFPGDELVLTKGQIPFAGDRSLRSLTVNRTESSRVWLEYQTVSNPASCDAGSGSLENYELLVVRSGRRNQLTASVASRQSLSADALFAGEDAAALSASASTYSDAWSRGIRSCDVNTFGKSKKFDVTFTFDNSLGFFGLNCVEGSSYVSSSFNYKSSGVEKVVGAEGNIALNADLCVTKRVAAQSLSEFALLGTSNGRTQITNPPCSPKTATWTLASQSSEFIRYTAFNGGATIIIRQVSDDCVSRDPVVSEPVITGYGVVISPFSVRPNNCPTLQFRADIRESGSPSGPVVGQVLFPPISTADRSGNIPEEISIPRLSGSDESGPFMDASRLTVTVVEQECIGTVSGVSASVSNIREQSTSAPPPDPYRTSRLAYTTGQKGIFRPHQTFAYVADRHVGETFEEIDLASDGTFTLDRPFDFAQPLTNLTSASGGWRYVSEVTQYGRNGEPVEQRDAIGVYSASLYGYRDDLPVAVASNARYGEIAVADFEDTEFGARATTHNNFTFRVREAAPSEYVETYNVVLPSTGTGAVIDCPWRAGALAPSYVTLHLRDADGATYLRDLENVTWASTTRPSNLRAGIAPFAESFTRVSGTALSKACEPIGGGDLYGEATLHYVRPAATATSDVVIHSSQAHTGAKSLKVRPGKPVAATQDRLLLNADAEYVLGGWVKHPRFAQSALSDFVDLRAGATVLDAHVDYTPVEGWYRFECTFTPTGEALELGFDTPDGDDARFDDLRLHPVEASFQSYVYALDDYRVLAALDENNYATVYKYDAQGVLIGTLKETERGLQTIQETRSYTRVRAGE